LSGGLGKTKVLAHLFNIVAQLHVNKQFFPVWRVVSQLVGLANNTKWSELQVSMAERSNNAPYWRTQATNGFVYPEKGWDADWSYHFRLGDYKDIEWCELTPRKSPEAISLAEVVALCGRIGFEIEINDEVVRIIGYRRVGE
jgi:hypothetical protein